MMLSRTAEGLFWLGRYMERAENVARLAEAGWRLGQMPAPADAPGNEWGGILVAAGCRETFGGDLETATAAEAVRHLGLDPENPSSIRACFTAARGNARAQRIAITAETWSVVNDAWREMRALSEADLAPRRLVPLLDRVRALAALFRGTVEGTMLRNEGYYFIRAGQFIERADSTARLLDVKYHVLLPERREIGSGYDQLQWNHILRAAGARGSYRWLYRQPVRADLVVDYLMLNAQCPRSLRYAYGGLTEVLTLIGRDRDRRLESLTEAESVGAYLDGADGQEIIALGLHEYLTAMVVRTNKLALTIGQDFGFGPVVDTAQSQTQG